TDAWAQLDKLYADTAQWEDLAEGLRRRAALTRDPAERASLLGRRAQILIEWLQAPEEAAAALRHARTITPEDSKLGDALVNALIKSGRDREAASMLESRIVSLGDGDNASRGDPADDRK